MRRRITSTVNICLLVAVLLFTAPAQAMEQEVIDQTIAESRQALAQDAAYLKEVKEQNRAGMHRIEEVSIRTIITARIDTMLDPMQQQVDKEIFRRIAVAFSKNRSGAPRLLLSG